MKVFVLVVLVVSAYFLYHGVVGLYKISRRPASGKTVVSGITEIVSPSDPVGLLVSVTVTVVGALGLNWSISKLK